jgi:hypothetical protein
LQLLLPETRRHLAGASRRSGTVKTIQIGSDVGSDVRQKLSRRVRTLKGLAAEMRVAPFPWSEDGRVEVSILGELELCQALGHAILRGDRDVQGALARFDFRFEAAVRCTFAYFEDHRQDEVRAQLQRLSSETTEEQFLFDDVDEDDAGDDAGDDAEDDAEDQDKDQDEDEEE